MCGSANKEDAASSIPPVSLLPKAMPVRESGIQALLMSSCFLGKASIILFIPSSPVKWPGSPVSPYTCWTATFTEQKQSWFCNEPPAHLLESELLNHPCDVLLYKLHKACKVFLLQGSQKCLAPCQRWSRRFWAQLVQRRSECTTFKLGPTAVGVYLRPFPESHPQISPASSEWHQSQAVALFVLEIGWRKGR